MTLDPILVHGTLAIRIHVAAALIAVLLTAVQFAGVKGSGLHRVMGYAWCGAMLVAAVSALFIYEIRIIGPFSPIHLLAVAVISGVYGIVKEARRHNVSAHKRAVYWLSGTALGIAGVLAFMPGRTMHAVVFGL